MTKERFELGPSWPLPSHTEMLPLWACMSHPPSECKGGVLEVWKDRPEKTSGLVDVLTKTPLIKGAQEQQLLQCRSWTRED